MKVAWIFMVALLVTTVTHAQCTRIHGVIHDAETKEALPGATVYLSSNVIVGTTTDTNGEFELQATAGDQLTIKFIGYETQTISVDSSCYASIELSPIATNLEEMTIQAERLTAEEFSVKKIRKLDIYTNPSAKADPLLAVNSLPSATTLDESANISLRGSSPAETGIFLNNVPITDAVRYAQLNGIGTFSIFNTALISQVQVYPGNPPLEFGNTTSGLISLSTDEVIPEKTSNSVSVSLANVGFYTQRPLTPASSLTVFSNLQPSAGIKWVNPTSLERLKRFNTIDLGLHYLNRLDERTMAKVFVYGNIESFRYETRKPTFTGSFNQEKLRAFTVLNLRHRLAHGELSFNQGFNVSDAAFQMSTIDIDLKLKDLFSSISYQHFLKKGEIKTGLSYDYKAATFSGVLPAYYYALGDEFPTTTVYSTPSINTPEVFVYGKYFLHPRWVVGAGLRKNIVFDSQPNFLSGQINLNYKPSSHWSILFSVGRYNKIQLSQDEYSESLHFQNDQYSLDISHSTSTSENSVSLFYKEGKQAALTNSIKGIEVFSRYRIFPNVKVQLSFTSLNALETIQQNVYSSRYDIHYFLRGSIEYKFLTTWTVSAIFLKRQGSFHLPVIGSTYHSTLGAYEPSYGDQSRLPDYNQLDISISKLLLVGKESSAVLFAGIGNIPNFKNVREYSYNYNYTQASEELYSLRTLYFGAVVNF